MSFRFFVGIIIAAVVSLFLLVGIYYESERRPIRTPIPTLQDWLVRWKSHGHVDEDIHHIYSDNIKPSTSSSSSSSSSDDDDDDDGDAHILSITTQTPSPSPASSYYSIPTNATYPDVILVLASMSSTDDSWLESEMKNITNVYTAVYLADSPSSALHPPKNKGHEAMSYLTYIIDTYASLPPISIFLHGHPTAWHNNYLLDMSTSSMIRHLNRSKVLNDGYMNLRCHWGPGCPKHLYPLATEYDDSKREELLIKPAWAEMFPDVDVPHMLAQPCCSQFAVTRHRIQSWPLEKYIHLRDWLLHTDLKDFVSGRVFEYTWQYLFNGSATFCPDPRICYCEGYGVCFENPKDYLDFFEMLDKYDRLKKELEAWADWKAAKEGNIRRGNADVNVIVQGGPDAAKEGSEARVKWLMERLEKTEEEMERRKRVAFDAGDDPRRRAKAIDATNNLNGKDLVNAPAWLVENFRG